MKGTNCCVIGCNKRKKKKTGGEGNRSDSLGEEDEWTNEKRLHPRTFHIMKLVQSGSRQLTMFEECVKRV